MKYHVLQIVQATVQNVSCLGRSVSDVIQATRWHQTVLARVSISITKQCLFV